MSNSVGSVSHAQAQRPEPTPRPKSEAAKRQPAPAATVSVSNAAKAALHEASAPKGQSARAPGAVNGHAHRPEAKAEVSRKA